MENVVPFARREQLADQVSGCPALTHVAGSVQYMQVTLRPTSLGYGAWITAITRRSGGRERGSRPTALQCPARCRE